ncbi:hypothetical protein J5Y09_19930 [Roseomonas sp. PWR1]|uniref:Uncharacterized protein n=1 Tax=Roseomonas nitratireducens TaxID=2820810 RepID=A0ABS4AXY3_9PROT|nr:hypothetical protein [Neoroseomonas nitratireducens]MBP0466206.1 hypothetical protein [Neoroseomonas nitratireducens]
MNNKTLCDSKSISLSLAISVADAYRQSLMDGISDNIAEERIRNAYLNAGGSPENAETQPKAIITIFLRMFPDWMLGGPRRPYWRRESELVVLPTSHATERRDAIGAQQFKACASHSREPETS